MSGFTLTSRKKEREREREQFILFASQITIFFKKEKQRIVSNIAKNAANEKMQKITKQVNTIAKQNNTIQKRDAGGRKRQSSFNHTPDLLKIFYLISNKF